MEEAPRKTKPEEESSPTEDGSPLAPEPKSQRISGEEEGGAGAGAGVGGGAKEEEDVEWKDVAANAAKYIAEFEAFEQTLKANNENLAQIKANLGQGKDREKLIPTLNKWNQDVLNNLNQLIEKCEMMLHDLSHEEPVNSSLPDDAEVDAPNSGQ